MGVREILGGKAQKSVGQQLKAYYAEKKELCQTDAARQQLRLGDTLKRYEEEHSDTFALFFPFPMDQMKEAIQKKMTPEEREQFNQSPNFFTGTQSYYHRVLEGATPVSYQLNRGVANLDTVIEMVNAGADDFNQTTLDNEAPSILLAHQFQNAMSELSECVKCFEDSNHIDFTEKRGRYIKCDWERLNDILYIHNKLKENHQWQLNQVAIQAWDKAHPDDPIQDTLSQMDKLAKIPEQEREFYSQPQPTCKKGNLLGAWLGLRKGSRGGRNS